MNRAIGIICMLIFLAGGCEVVGSSRSADLRLAIEVTSDSERELVLEIIDNFAEQRHLRVSDRTQAASETLGAPTIVRFYEDSHRAVIMVTDRLGRDRILIGAHNAEIGENSVGFDDDLLRYLRTELEMEIIVNPRE